MGRVYAVAFENVAVTAAQDLFMVAPADDKPIKLLGFMLSQSTELGDAAEEMLRIKVIRGHATVGSGGSAVDAAPVHCADAADAATCRTNDTTIASTGTAVDLLADTFNVRAGYQFWWTPETAPTCSEANGVRMVVRLMAAPADSVTMGGTLYFEEMA